MKAFYCLVLLLGLAACATPDAGEAPSNRDVPQHFSMTLEVSLTQTPTGLLQGSLVGNMDFDESLQALAEDELAHNRDNRTPAEIDLLTRITAGSCAIPLSGFTVAYGNEKTTTDETGMFEIALTTSAPTIDIMYYDVEKKAETIVLAIETPEKIDVTTRLFPLDFDHHFPHGHPGHNHATDHGQATIEGGLSWVPSLACRKCNGWWDWDGGRAGSDCFIALSMGFGPCWAEAMSKVGVTFGNYCNGTKNCSKWIGHGWSDNHTHGSSKWTCNK